MRLFTFFTFFAVLFFGFVASAQTVDDFVFSIQQNSGLNQQSIRLTSSPGSIINIDWGDGTSDSYTNLSDQAVYHNYSIGTYTVVISGQLDSFKMNLGFARSTSYRNVTQWGNSQWKTMHEAFESCLACSISATDVPNLSQVTDMSYMFEGAGSANSNPAFDSSNTDISQWDVSNVTNMEGFAKSGGFNTNISTWDVSNVTNMKSMFESNARFNQTINTWDISSVTDMSKMFAFASFNQSLNGWDIPSGLNMQRMFEGNQMFNNSIDLWDMTNTPDIKYIFNNSVFNQPLNNWDMSNYTDFSYMFYGAISYNQPLDNWNVSNVTLVEQMFANTQAFNQPLEMWNLSSLTIMDEMFMNAFAYNQPLDNLDISNITSMHDMFNGASSYNQPLNWGVNNFFGFGSMFENASSFNQDLSLWDFSNQQYSLGIYSMVQNSGLDANNYDKLLQRLVAANFSSTFRGDPRIFGNGLEYCDSFSRNILVQRGWIIIGDTQSSNCPDNNVTGMISYDFDNNGCDPNDVLASNIAVEINDGIDSFNIYTINGQYSVDLPAGTYTITPHSDTILFTNVPASTSITVANATSINEDFCLTATTPTDDLEIAILPLEDARPGFDTNYKLIYKNKGNTQLSGSVNFTYEDDFMSFLMATPATTSSSTGMLSWDFVDLDPFETREMEFTMNLNTPTDPTFPLNSGDLLDFNASINPTANEDTPLDNVFDLQQTVVNSYDPNDKTCLQGETILPTMVGEYVHYRIRFENEGTASAITVRIVDYIDTSKFDITTLTPLSASHDYTTTITDGNKVEFLFDNINLPFTAPASQGYVLFKIKTVDTLVLGDDFSNQAEIYFDFNFPIITNLETTEVAVPLNINDSNLLEISLYPNPAQNTISLSSNLAFNQYTIYDTLGAIVLHHKIDSPTLSQDILVDHLVSGLYFVKVKGDQISSVLKLIKD